mmetsp:Transcript_7226/g.10568  ORF Transcript_7226/g.10568 Transcript_7226/m.10568 type:complete len:263 (-) Transcript_7226:204-992(-)
MEIYANTIVNDAAEALDSAIVELVLNSSLGNCDASRELISNLRHRRRLSIVGISVNPPDHHVDEKGKVVPFIFLLPLVIPFLNILPHHFLFPACSVVTQVAGTTHTCAVMEGKLSLHTTSYGQNEKEEVLLLISMGMADGSLAQSVDQIFKLAYIGADSVETVVQGGDGDRDQIGENPVQPPVDGGLSALDISLASGACALLLAGFFGGRKILSRHNSDMEDDMSEAEEVLVEDSLDVSDILNLEHSILNSSGSVTVSCIRE